MDNNTLPAELLFSADYTWVKIEGDEALFGMVGPAAQKVKEFVFINLPKVGKVLKKGETYVSLEAIKWSGHLASPLDGEIIKVNDDLFDEPATINQDPYGKGWIIRIKIVDPKQIDNLLKADSVHFD